MDIKSLQLKNKLIDDNGQEYLDLSEPSTKQGAQIKIKGVIVVDTETEMRPDLISYKFYGSSNYVDIICKANNIFNPFSIIEGQVLVIPDFNNENQILSKPVNTQKKDLRAKFTDTSRLSEDDQNRVQRLKEKARTKKGGVKNPLPPNMLPPGTSGKIFKDGEIILGSNLNNNETL